MWVCGGPLSNFEATQAFADLVPENTPVICTGDIAGYCADPSGCVDLIRKHGWHVIAGNCEIELGQGSASCGCGFETGSACDIAAGAWFAYASAALNEDDRAWMRGRPDWAVFSHHGRRFAVIHGGASQVNRFLWPSDSDAAFRIEIDLIRAALGPIDGVLAGHCSVAFTRVIDGVQWINAGILGLPPNDGRPDTRFVTLIDGHARIHRLRYDHTRAASRMAAVGLTQGYQTTLQTGRWPTQDILPAQMR
ncbi:MAG: metallophosphoesterase family protein [Rhodobacteraceae bacterium]|nr:metallophosphoesterase family protein [Paracoccaceae bacterium]